MKFDQDLCLNLQYDFGKMNSTLGSVVPLAMFYTEPSWNDFHLNATGANSLRTEGSTFGWCVELVPLNFSLLASSLPRMATKIGECLVQRALNSMDLSIRLQEFPFLLLFSSPSIVPSCHPPPKKKKKKKLQNSKSRFNITALLVRTIYSSDIVGNVQIALRFDQAAFYHRQVI